jgi:hypothetical protein
MSSYTLRRIQVKPDGKKRYSRLELKMLSAVKRNIQRWLNGDTAAQIEATDEDGDLIYFYDGAGVQEIYKADGSPTDSLKEMGR